MVSRDARGEGTLVTRFEQMAVKSCFRHCVNPSVEPCLNMSFRTEVRTYVSSN
jgi:hypothetical protein